jgi:uncharacterized membrane protein required for colicin V production
VTAIDWLALALVLLAAIGGVVQGFVWSALSLVGLVAGAVIGGRFASVLLSEGPSSGYAPLLALAGAVAFAVVFELIGSAVGALLRRRQRTAAARNLDSAGGVIAGALIGLAIVWVLGAMALQLPGQTDLRRAVQRSAVLQRLNEIVPPRTLLNALRRVDPFTSFTGPPVPTEAPDPRVLALPGVRAARASIVRVLGTARHRGQRLGRGAQDRRHGRARGRRGGRHDSGVADWTGPPSTGGRLRPAQRRGRAAGAGALGPAAAPRRPAARRGRRCCRISRKRSVRRRPRQDRRDRDGVRP